MGNRKNFGPGPPQQGTFNKQTMIPASSSNPHCANHQFFPVQGAQNLNYPIPMNQMSNMNNRQPMPQILPFNSMAPSNFFNQNHNLGFPNQIQDMNQLFQLQMFNFNPQIVPGNLTIPQNFAFMGNNQTANLGLPQNVGFHMNAGPTNLNLPQNVAFAGNNQLGFIDPSGILQNMGSLIASNGTPMATQQLLGSSNSVQGNGQPVPSSQNQTNFHARPSKFQGSQRNAIGNNLKNNEKSAHYKKYNLNPKHETSGSRVMKPRFEKMQNSKGNFSSPNMRMRREDNVGARQISVDSALRDQAEQQRSVTLNYTDQEIQRWREERKKNYPSKANMEKKLMEKMRKPEIFDEAAQLRRQQLKEVLAKQAELGCEVAEIPSYYLSDPEQQVHGKKTGGKAFSKKENFQNRFKKRGRFDKNDNFSNKKGFAQANSSNGNGRNDCVPQKKWLINDGSVSHRPTKKEEPTLLQKLLGADIKRDKHHLLQAFRFMASNSFFEHWPRNELKFPQVMIKEAENENDLNVGKSVGGKNSLFLGEFEPPAGENDNGDCYNNSRLKKEGLVVNYVQEIGVMGEPQEEEGEIID